MNCVLFAKRDPIFSLKEIEHLKNTRKIWKSQGILSVRDSGNHVKL